MATLGLNQGCCGPLPQQRGISPGVPIAGLATEPTADTGVCVRGGGSGRGMGGGSGMGKQHRPGGHPGCPRAEHWGTTGARLVGTGLPDGSSGAAISRRAETPVGRVGTKPREQRERRDTGD